MGYQPFVFQIKIGEFPGILLIIGLLHLNFLRLEIQSRDDIIRHNILPLSSQIRAVYKTTTFEQVSSKKYCSISALLSALLAGGH
jgi:hypothetical protein